ncbi:hypothetical protein [Bradyrhizobium brasilense]|uniref:hypothetical protein n=1 Tax=Bradyrhizobium brasilense TaxID=1419277 RepID=UPI001E558CB7|nr:hypothetical protein [Bradyrhizobium brasilense]MCC8968906.1 hypothetical protein [Bradyrhizobium brasilense]
MTVRQPATDASRSVKLLGPLWPTLLQHLKATVTAALNNKAQCELIIEDNAGLTCQLDSTPNQIVLSTGQIIRVAVISKIVAERFANCGPPAKNIILIDPHFYDDFFEDENRNSILEKSPLPGIAPAFSEGLDSEGLVNWAETHLSPPPERPVANFYVPLCLYALSFLVLHEAAHLLFNHPDVHKRISREKVKYRDNDQRCIEIHADFGASESCLSGMLAQARLPHDFVEFFRLTGVGIIVALSFGHHSLRGLRAYDDPIGNATFLGRKYPHPAVRFALIQRHLCFHTKELCGLVVPQFLQAKNAILFALDDWYLREVTREGAGDWAVPFPFAHGPIASRYIEKRAEDFQERHFPAFFRRHYPGCPIPLPRWKRSNGLGVDQIGIPSIR